MHGTNEHLINSHAHGKLPKANSIVMDLTFRLTFGLECFYLTIIYLVYQVCDDEKSNNAFNFLQCTRKSKMLHCSNFTAHYISLKTISSRPYIILKAFKEKAQKCSFYPFQRHNGLGWVPHLLTLTDSYALASFGHVLIYFLSPSQM